MATNWATDEVLSLLLKFVNLNSDFVDVQWDRRMKPRLLFNPYSEDSERKKMAAHYFLLASSILEDEVIGFPENARRLLIYLHGRLGQRLFEIRKPHLFDEEIVKCGFYDELGYHRQSISKSLTDVNSFVSSTARKDLIEYSRKFSKPSDLVQDLAQNTRRTNESYKDKLWTYMRWMVRPKPDLELLNHFSPEDLQVPLTRETANVAASLGLVDSVGPYLWKDRNTASNAR